MKKIFGFFQLNDDVIALEQKLFQVITCTVVLFALIIFLFNSQHDFPAIINILLAITGLFSALFFCASRFIKFYDWFPMVFILSLLMVLSVIWFHSAGADGPVIIFFIFLVVLGTFITKGLFRKLLPILVSVQIALLFFLEVKHPEWLYPYSSVEEREIDIIFATLASIVVLGSLVIFIKKSFDKQNASLTANKLSLELFNQKLIQARDIAEKATFAKSYFLANMSHEIRTPLNGIIGSTELLKQQVQDEDKRELINTLQSCSHLLLNIINDVLDVSKIEAGQLSLQQAPFQIKHCVNSVVLINIAQMKSLGKSLAINYHIESDIEDNVVGDKNRLKQILLNLISNAVKFTNEGSIQISVTKDGMVGEKQILTFKIADTGIGISEKNIHLLFQPFTQIMHANNKQFGGTGLGLSICKKLVEMMDGTIWVHSIEGKGSTFCFQIALNISNEVVEEEIEQIPQIFETKKCKILLAEDNLMNQFVAKKIFSSLGYTIDTAVNGVEALAMAKKVKYDLIFMDIQMPEMDGLEATKKIHDATLLHKPVIIAMTANALKEDEDICYAAGMNDFLSKPFTIEQLKMVLNRWI